MMTIPDSEREWFQWIGRTARSDNRGQYSVILSRQDSTFGSLNDRFFAEDAYSGRRFQFKPNLIKRLLTKGDERIAANLEDIHDKTLTGVRTHQMCHKFYRRYRRRSNDPWPNTPEESKLRDFLENHDFTVEAIDRFTREMGL